MARATSVVPLAIDDIATIGSGDSATDTVTISSLVVPSTANRILIVFVGTSGSGNGPDPATVVFNGSEALTKRMQRGHPTSVPGPSAQTGPDGISIWYLLNPTATTADVVVDWDGSNQARAFAYAAVYTNVDLAEPFTGAMRSGNAGDNLQDVGLHYASNQEFIPFIGEAVLWFCKLNDGSGTVTDWETSAQGPNHRQPQTAGGVNTLHFWRTISAGLGTGAGQYRQARLSSYGSGHPFAEFVDLHSTPGGVGHTRTLDPAYGPWDGRSPGSFGRTINGPALLVDTLWNGSRMETEWLQGELWEMDDPPVHTSWEVIVGYLGLTTPGETVNFTVQLREGTTLIAEDTGTISFGSSFVTLLGSPTEAEIDNITDFADLNIRVQFDHATDSTAAQIAINFIMLRARPPSDDVAFPWEETNFSATGTGTTTDLTCAALRLKYPPSDIGYLVGANPRVDAGTEFCWVFLELRPIGWKLHSTDALLVPGDQGGQEVITVQPGVTADAGWGNSPSNYFADGRIAQGAYSGGRYYWWIRFPTVAIAKDKRIDWAELRLYAAATSEQGTQQSGEIEARVQAFAEDDAVIPTSRADFISRAKTTALAYWSWNDVETSEPDQADDPGLTPNSQTIGGIMQAGSKDFWRESGLFDASWNPQAPINGVYGSSQRARMSRGHMVEDDFTGILNDGGQANATDYGPTNLAHVIQEMVDRAGWVSGDALVLCMPEFSDQFQASGLTRWYFGRDTLTGDLLHAELIIAFSDAPVPGQETHTADALLQQEQTEEHTTDAIKVDPPVEVVHTTDAVAVDRLTEDHDTDAILILAPQKARPISDVTTTGWETAPTPAQAHWEQLNEETPDPTDHVFWDN